MIKRGRHISCQRASIHKQGVTYIYIYMYCPAYTNRVLRAAQHTQTGSTCHARHSGCYVYIYKNNAVYLYIYMYLYILAPHAYTNRVLHATPAQSVRGYSNHPSLPKASEAVQSVRGLSMRLSLLKAHCVLGPDLYSLQVS